MPIYNSSIGPSPNPIPIGGRGELSVASPVAVYIKRYWSDPWVIDYNITPQRVTFSTAETQIGHASFIYRYGARAGEDTIVPVDYNRWLIKVVFGRDTWVGQIQAQAREQYGDASGAPAGVMTISALSMESLFHHNFIMTSQYVDLDAPLPPVFPQPARTPETAGQGMTFNEGGRPNKYETIQGDPYFAKESGSGWWSTRDIIYYAVRHWMPTNASGAAVAPLTISPLDLAKLPNWDRPQVETHGYRPIEVINRIITRRRLLVWWFEYREADNMIWQNTDDAIWQNGDLWGTPDSLIMRIATLNQYDLQAGLNSNEIIPGNPRQFTLDADNDHTTQVIVDQDSNSLIDQVVVQGGKRRSVFSLKFNEDSTYTGQIRGTSDWSSSLEAEYEEAGSGESNYPTARGKRRAWHELWRSKTKYRDVFSKFRILANEYVPTSDGYKISPFSVRILPSLPLLQNGDYSGTRIATGLEQFDDSSQEDFMQPVAFFKIKPKHKPEQEVPDTTWVDASKLGQNSDVAQTDKKHDHDLSCDFRATGEDASFRLEVDGAPQHAIATKEGLTGDGNFDARPEDKARGDITWREMVATVAVEDDRYCEVVWPPTTSGDFLKRTLLINAGNDYRKDFVAQGTALDVNQNTGQLIVNTVGGYYRDDTDKLMSIATRAAEYYTTVRNMLRLRCAYQYPVTTYNGNPSQESPFRLGSFLISIKHGSILSVVLNSVVTQYSVDFPVVESRAPVPKVGPPMIEVITSFGEVTPQFFIPKA